MADEKITVSWDDLTSRKVERRLKEQDALARNRDYANITEASLPQPAPSAKPSALAKLWRNSLFALALFGLVGGVIAWAAGSAVQLRPPAKDVKTDYDERWQAIQQMGKAMDKMGIASEQAGRAIEDAAAAARAANPYFAIKTDPRYTETGLPTDELKSRLDEQQRRLNEVVAQDQIRRDNDRFKVLILNILAYGMRGVIIALFLAVAIPLTERNMPAAVMNGSIGAVFGLIGGIIVSLLVEKVYQFVSSAMAGAGPQGQQMLASVAKWGLMGLFLTVAPGIVMRNWKKLVIGLLGGVIGGLIGGAVYDSVAAATSQGHRLAELTGMVSIGLIAGLATGLIENAAKTGWLRVTQGLIAGKQFILYRNPTFVGSGPDCQIYLFKDPKVGRRHAAIHIVPGGFELEDLPLGDATYINGRPVTRARLKNGDRVQIGGTCLVFQEKASAA